MYGMGRRVPGRRASLLLIVCAAITLFGLTAHAFASWTGEPRGPVSLRSCSSGHDGGLAGVERSGSCALHAGYVIPAVSAIVSLLTLLFVDYSPDPSVRRWLSPPPARPPLALPTA